MSRLRLAVGVQLAKAARLGLGVPVGRVVRVFNLNSGLVYRFLRELVDEGIAERSGRGVYRLRDTEKAQAWASFMLQLVEPSPLEGLDALPEVYYYVALPPSIEWLGFPGRILVIVDEALKSKVSLPDSYLAVYTRMRGRAWRFDWDLRAPLASPEQALADLLSYDPDYPVEQYILLNLGRVDLDETARRATPAGLRRLATFLSFLRLATGKPLPARFDYIGLTDPELLGRRLGEYTSLVFANGVDARRGI